MQTSSTLLTYNHLSSQSTHQCHTSASFHAFHSLKICLSHPCTICYLSINKSSHVCLVCTAHKLSYIMLTQTCVYSPTWSGLHRLQGPQIHLLIYISPYTLIHSVSHIQHLFPMLIPCPIASLSKPCISPVYTFYKPLLWIIFHHLACRCHHRYPHFSNPFLFILSASSVSFLTNPAPVYLLQSSPINVTTSATIFLDPTISLLFYRSIRPTAFTEA